MNLHTLPGRTALDFWKKAFPTWNWHEDDSGISYESSGNRRISLTPEDMRSYQYAINRFIETGESRRL